MYKNLNIPSAIVYVFYSAIKNCNCDCYLLAYTCQRSKLHIFSSDSDMLSIRHQIQACYPFAIIFNECSELTIAQLIEILYSYRNSIMNETEHRFRCAKIHLTWEMLRRKIFTSSAPANDIILYSSQVFACARNSSNQIFIGKYTEKTHIRPYNFRFPAENINYYGLLMKSLFVQHMYVWTWKE